MEKMTTRKLNLYCSLLFAAGYAMAYVVSVSFSSYLNLAGYANATIATLSSITSIASYIVKPIAGQIIDAGKCKKTGFVLSALTLIFSVIFYAAPTKTMPIAVLYAVFAITCCGSISFLMDSWIIKLIQQNEGMEYARLRAFGSLSYAVTGLIFGTLFNLFGYTANLVVVPAIILLEIYIYTRLPDPELTEASRHKTRILDHLEIFKDPMFDIFLFIESCGMCVLSALDSYIPVLILQMGGTTVHSGIATFVLAGTEFLCGMFMFSKVADKVGTDRTVWMGLIGFTVKCFAVSLMPSPVLIILACLTQAISYCFFMPGKMRYIQENVTAENVGTALSVANLVQAACSVLIFNPLIGSFSNSYGTAGMLERFGVISACLGVAFIIALRIFKKKA